MFCRKNNSNTLRYSGYDYSSPGCYFVTIALKNRNHLFGEIVDGVMVLNSLGSIVRDELIKTPCVRKNVSINEFVVMPDHIHAIIEINFKYENHGVGEYCNTHLHHGMFMKDQFKFGLNGINAEFKSPSQTVGAIVRGIKSATTVKINRARKTPGEKVWQRNYFEHIIRHPDGYNRISYYIRENPKRWNGIQFHSMSRYS